MRVRVRSGARSFGSHASRFAIRRARSGSRVLVSAVAAAVCLPLVLAPPALTRTLAFSNVPHLRPLLPSGQVSPPALARWPRVDPHLERPFARPSIVGGANAAQGQLGFMAFVLHFDSAGTGDFACSGTVVSANVVLTAAHCAIDEATGAPLDPSGFRVATGTVDWTGAANRQVRPVSKVIVNPAYNRATGAFDAALLALPTPTTAPAIRLGGSADRYLEQPGTGALVVGWGDTYAGSGPQAVLRWAPTVVQRSAYCGQFHSFGLVYNPSIQLCAVNAPTYDTGTCNGDSGGPLVTADSKGYAVEFGVTSMGPADCNTVSADYFTAVPPLSSWANSWINAVALAGAPPSSTASKLQLPLMTLSAGRFYVRQTVAAVVGGPFRREHAYSTTCWRGSAIRITCSVSFSSGPSDYWGNVTVYFTNGSDGNTYWSDNYSLHRVNDRCYFHSGHRNRCRIYTKRGTW